MTPERLEEFRILETSLHKTEVRNSRRAVDALLTNDFMEFGKSGAVYHKQDTLDALEGEHTDLQVEVSQFAARELSPDIVLVTYRSTTPDNGVTNRTSIWVHRDGRWQMTFHQGTKVSV